MVELSKPHCNAFCILHGNGGNEYWKQVCLHMHIHQRARNTNHSYWGIICMCYTVLLSRGVPTAAAEHSFPWKSSVHPSGELRHQRTGSVVSEEGAVEEVALPSCLQNFLAASPQNEWSRMNYTFLPELHLVLVLYMSLTYGEGELMLLMRSWLQHSQESAVAWYSFCWP